MNNKIELLLHKLGLQTGVVAGELVELAIILLAAGFEPEAEEYPLWIRILQGAPELTRENLIPLLQEALHAYEEGDDE